jgi:hypothetical protein
VVIACNEVYKWAPPGTVAGKGLQRVDRIKPRDIYSHISILETNYFKSNCVSWHGMDIVA